MEVDAPERLRLWTSGGAHARLLR